MTSAADSRACLPNDLFNSTVYTKTYTRCIKNAVEL